MDIRLFDYNLPSSLIAQYPITPRDHSKLLVFDKKSKTIKHDKFINLGDYLRDDDVLVFNNTKVFPARLYGRKITGGKIEVLILKNLSSYNWETLIGGKVRRIGMEIVFDNNLKAKVIGKISDGIWQVKFNKNKSQLLKIVEKIGQTPTPPYVKKITKLKDYQTVYADKVGSVAAPTAGFHFTKRLLSKLKRQGIQMEYVTLHVGYGTFQPVKEKDITKHHIHEEFTEVNKTVMNRLYQAKKEGRRIIAVGTTTVRALESIMGSDRALARSRTKAKARAFTYPRGGFKGWLNIFIYPGYKYKFVDAMITNFHLPKSTLLMLVSAFVGRKSIIKIYKKAVKLKYRFYSFGDGMFLK
ncbi:MAG: tRNA preQ1(34) S-adenosylmethionine ribosyltransferase-isomerase QueA [bacterium]|nr:tRNA preQ1(34) S-adenosylmethionine ribosyltransferase-isomerase QueA [bacterium]